MCEREGSPESRNIRLTIAYVGTAYSGWQIQPHSPTVQGVIEGLLHELTGAPCRLRAAGRTDAGVHAQGQVANFHTAASIPLRGFHRGLNALLPSDIAILEVDEVDADFDTRRHNQGKHYRYSLWNQRNPSPQQGPTSWHLYRPLDLGAMAEAAQLFQGTHDFCAFRAASCERETTVRTIFRCTLCDEGPLVHLDVEGTAFLRNMVRIMAGTLVEVGLGKRAPATVADLLRPGADRRLAGLTAPAHGLCLVRVFI